VKEGDDHPDNCSQASSGRFPVAFPVNSGNYQGMKKLILCSELELELTTKQLKTLRGVWRPNISKMFSISIVILI
jgi:hypothetical protein